MALKKKIKLQKLKCFLEKVLMRFFREHDNAQVPGWSVKNKMNIKPVSYFFFSLPYLRYGTSFVKMYIACTNVVEH